MSGKIPYKLEEVDGAKNAIMNAYAFETLDKTFFENLAKAKPDYLVMDQYVESAIELIETMDGNFFPNAFYIEHSTFLKNIEKKHVYDIFNPARYDLYSKAVVEFVKKLKTIIPEEKIIVVRTHATTKKFENGVFGQWDQQEMFIKAQRKLWCKYDDLLISQMPKCRVIDMRNGDYYSAYNKYASFNRNHFNEAYYKDLLNNVNKIVLQDLIIEKGGQNAKDK